LINCVLVCVSLGLLDKPVTMNAEHPAKYQNRSTKQDPPEDLDTDIAGRALHPSANTVRHPARELPKRIVVAQPLGAQMIRDRWPRRRWATVEQSAFQTSAAVATRQVDRYRELDDRIQVASYSLI
jgi:hypothetical protein